MQGNAMLNSVRFLKALIKFSEESKLKGFDHLCFPESVSLVTCVPVWGKHISLGICFRGNT